MSLSKNINSQDSNICVSVVICAHNPRREFLEKTLTALTLQCFPLTMWEVIIVDNSSKNNVINNMDISWHPQARVVVENQLGLTHARMKGISEAKGDVLVYVDDDNVLAADYLTCCWDIALKYPYLGVWGGAINGVFETSITPFIKKFEGLLANRDCLNTVWGNMYGQYDISPYGAGLCARIDVLKYYRDNVVGNSERLNLDRKGSLLTGGGDLDIGYTALDLNLGIGRFPCLQLHHLIPRERTEVSYLCRIAYGGALSDMALKASREVTRHGVSKPTFIRLLILLLKNVRNGFAGMKIAWSAWCGARCGYRSYFEK